MSYKKSNVTGRTWSTPFNTPFFFRWGEWSIKVPMDHLREEYNAWKNIQHRPEPEPPEPGPFLSSPSGSFNWAEDVEHRLFSRASNDSDNANTKLDSQPDTNHVERPTVDQVAPEGVAVVGSRSILSASSEGCEEGSGAREDKVADSNPRIDNAIYRIVQVSTASNNLSIHMVEDATVAATTTNAGTDGSTTARKLSEAIELLAGVGLLNLDTYATVFETAAARACASGNPFWLKDPTRGYEVVV